VIRLPRPIWTFLLLYLFSLTINISCALALHVEQDPRRLDSDALEYYNLAGSILDGTYRFDSRRVLGHVLLLVLFRLVTGTNLRALQLLVTSFFSLSASTTYLVARRFVANDLVAATGGIAVALWPLFAIYGKTLYSETTALPLFLAFLAALPRGSQLGGSSSTPARRWMLSGAMLAVAMLVRPMYLFFLPFVLPILCWEDGSLGRGSKRMAWLVLGCALTLAPWSTYASLREGRPLLLSANGGETLAGGLNPRMAHGGYRMFVAADGRRTWTGPGKWAAESDTGYLSEAELTLPRSDRDRLLKERTWHWIATEPMFAIRLEVAKLLYMWGIYPFWNGLQQTIFGNIPTILVIVLGASALVRFKEARRRLVMLWSLPLFTSGVALVSWGSWRFRQPADVGLLLLAVFFVWSSASRKGIGLRRLPEGGAGQ
jgi:hypothetical protein